MDVHAVSAILTEAASWLEDRGIPLWKIDDVSVEQLRGDVASGLFALGDANGTAAGTLKYQLHDSLFWPDVPDGESAFVHRVAVRRDYAGLIATHQDPSCGRSMNGLDSVTIATSALARTMSLATSTR